VQPHFRNERRSSYLRVCENELGGGDAAHARL
jgi:hypothetical protein